MRPTIPDLSEPLLSPRRVRRIVLWAIVLALLVAFCFALSTQPDPILMFENSR